MLSSSRLFPVELRSADIRADLCEDVYLLKPGRAKDPSVELALTRLTRADGQAPGVPVVLVHGSFSNRRFWYSPRAIGPGAYLARLGFDVWIAEMRGHGLSPRNQDYRNNCVESYVAEDLPAIADFVIEMSGQTPHWVGHSLGGSVLAAAAAGGYLDNKRMASLAIFGSQVTQNYWRLKFPPFVWLVRLILRRYGYFSGRRFKRGPEDEPQGVILDGLRWHGLFGRFGSRKDNWWERLPEVNVPLLAVAGAGDDQDCPAACQALFQRFGSEKRQWLCLGVASGFSNDFGHIDMLVSRAAQQEVWPLLAQWLEGGPLSLPDVSPTQAKV